MSWGFRKSFKLAPGVRLNVGRRSTGISVGPRGVKVSANTKRRARLSLSRNGVFWRKQL